MKFTVLMLFLIPIGSFPARADIGFDGCRFGEKRLQFPICQQIGSACKARIILEPNAYVEYAKVWNEDSLALFVNGKLIASGSGTMELVTIEHSLNGIPLSCQVSDEGFLPIF